MKKNYFNNLEIKENQDQGDKLQSENIVNEDPNTTNALSINLKQDQITDIENKILNTNPNIFKKIKIRGDRSCAYRAIIASLQDNTNYLALRQLTASQYYLREYQKTYTKKEDVIR